MISLGYIWLRFIEISLDKLSKDQDDFYKSKIFGKYLKKQFKYSNKILTLYNYLISSIKLNSSNCSIYHPTYYGKGLININKTPIVFQC